MKFLVGIFLVVSSFVSMASDALPSGSIKGLSYRGGWVTFKVVNSLGVNQCASCPTDPGAMNSGNCWVEESKTAQLSMLLGAQARNKSISGRVSSLTTNCEVYQMTVAD